MPLLLVSSQISELSTDCQRIASRFPTGIVFVVVTLLPLSCNSLSFSCSSAMNFQKTRVEDKVMAGSRSTDLAEFRKLMLRPDESYIDPDFTGMTDGPETTVKPETRRKRRPELMSHLSADGKPASSRW